MAIDVATLLDGLTAPQREAAEHIEGPLLVLAAAGSGKTRVITRRIAHLIACGVPPWAILALTFTNKAAGEMRERIHTLLGDDTRLTRGLTTTTFHSLCARLLRRYAADANIPGLKPDYTIYDSGDQMTLMKRTLGELQMSTSNWPPRSVLSAISNAKNALLDADGFAASADDYYKKQVSKIYSAYESKKRSANAVDFDDLLLLTGRMLRENEQIAAEVRERWRFLLIDEYQDTNGAQLEIARRIAGEPVPSVERPGEMDGPNICVVGDPDQAIYGWRGADISNILEFEEHYPNARVIALGENFRSTEPILATADHLIQHNKNRRHKPLFTTTPGGEAVEVTLCRDERHESALVADWLKARNEADVPYRDMAVFYRTNALSRVIEDELRGAGIPYTIARGTAFYDREEIKTALGYLRVVANPADDVSLLRVVNTPTRGIGKASLDKVAEFAAQRGLPMYEALSRAKEVPDLSARALSAMERFTTLIGDLSGQGSFLGSEIPTSLADLAERVIDESGLRAMYLKRAETTKAEGDEERLDNLDELISSAVEFENAYSPEDDPAAFPGPDIMEAGSAVGVPPMLALLRAYLESVALVADADAVDPAQGAVTLMTLHAAKGLEFHSVAMIGLEEGLLPHSRALESEAEMEEERRLCFVGITRAMRRLHVSSARYRTHRGIDERTIASRFLEELPGEHTRVSDQADPMADMDASIPGSSGGSRGWGQSRRGMAGPMAGGSGGGPATGAVAEAKAQFPPGCKVRHPQFGVGTIVDVLGGQMARAKVDFHEVGVKTLVLEYARLRKI